MINFSIFTFVLVLLNISFSDAQNMSNINPIAMSYKTSHFGLKGKVKTMDVLEFSETTYSFSPSGMLTKEKSRYGTILYSYDVKDHLTKISYSDPENEPTRVTCDSKGNIVNKYDSDSSQWFYEYNDNNQLVTTKFGKEKKLDFKYKYDAESRLIQVEEYGEGSEPITIRVNEYTKTENGWIVTNTSTDSSSGQKIILTRVYNSKGDLEKSEYSNDKTVNTFKFEYDENGNYTGAYMDDEEEPTEERILTYY